MAKWADPSERCREIARREREIYDQQELPDLLEHMAEESARLRAEAANIAAQRDEAIARATVAEERLRAVEAELHTMKTAGIIEVASRNNRVTEYMFHWEGRALDAEAELARIRAADRTSITVRTNEAAKMRKGQAI